MVPFLFLLYFSKVSIQGMHLHQQCNALLSVFQSVYLRFLVLALSYIVCSTYSISFEPNIQFLTFFFVLFDLTVCLGYDEETLYYLHSQYFTSNCDDAYKANFLHDGWYACNGGRLTIDMYKKRNIASLKVAGLRGSTTTSPLVEFNLLYSYDGINYILHKVSSNINHMLYRSKMLQTVSRGKTFLLL